MRGGGGIRTRLLRREITIERHLDSFDGHEDRREARGIETRAGFLGRIVDCGYMSGFCLYESMSIKCMRRMNFGTKLCKGYEVHRDIYASPPPCIAPNPICKLFLVYKYLPGEEIRARAKQFVHYTTSNMYKIQVNNSSLTSARVVSYLTKVSRFQASIYIITRFLQHTCKKSPPAKSTTASNNRTVQIWACPAPLVLFGIEAPRQAVQGFANAGQYRHTAGQLYDL